MTSQVMTPARPAAKLRFQTGNVLMISFCHLVHDIYSSFLAPLLPLLIAKLSMSLTQAGLLSGLMQLPALLNPYIGVLADRISVRMFIALAPAMTAVPMSLIGVAPNFGVLVLFLLVAGVSVSLFHVPAPVMIAGFSGDFKGRGMSFFMVGGELARTLGPLVAVGAVSLMGLEGFYPIMVFGLAASAWLLLKFKHLPATHQAVKKPVSLKGTWSEMHHILLPLSGILIARGFMHAATASFLPTYVELETGNLWLAGISLTVYESAGVFGVLAAGSLSDRLGRRRVLLIALISAPLALFMFTISSAWVAFAALLITGFTLLATTPVMLALVQEHSISSPAAANGFFMLVSFTARSAVTVIVGFGGDLLGLQTTFMISAALGLLGLPFIMMLPHDEKGKFN